MVCTEYTEITFIFSPGLSFTMRPPLKGPSSKPKDGPPKQYSRWRLKQWNWGAAVIEISPACFMLISFKAGENLMGPAPLNLRMHPCDYDQLRAIKFFSHPSTACLNLGQLLKNVLNFVIFEHYDYDRALIYHKLNLFLWLYKRYYGKILF